MNDYRSFQNNVLNDSGKKKEKYFSNVFSKIRKTEKEKKYPVLNFNLNLLSNEIKLLEEYENPGAFGKIKKFNLGKILALNNDGNHFNNYYGRRGISFRKKKNVKCMKSTNITDNNNNAPNNNNIIKPDKNKTENNKYLNLKKIIDVKNGPNIYLNLDKSSDTNMDSSRYNNNLNISSRLPNINNKSPKPIYLFTENNDIKPYLMNDENNDFTKIKIPTNNTNLSRNSFMKKFPRTNDSTVLKKKINKDELSQSTEKVLKIIQKKNKKFTKKINLKLAQQNIVDWEMTSRIKLAEWKYGIADIEKYFVDLKAYGKPEEEELIKRKTFYNKMEDLIDEINQEKEERNLNNLKNKYKRKEKKGINALNKNEKKIEENNDMNMVDTALNRYTEENDALKKIKLRKKAEEKKRYLINNILTQSEMRRNAINKSTDKLNDQEIEIEKDENNILKSDINNDKNNFKQNKGILIKNIKAKGKD